MRNSRLAPTRAMPHASPLWSQPLQHSREYWHSGPTQKHAVPSPSVKLAWFDAHARLPPPPISHHPLQRLSLVFRLSRWFGLFPCDDFTGPTKKRLALSTVILLIQLALSAFNTFDDLFSGKSTGTTLTLIAINVVKSSTKLVVSLVHWVSYYRRVDILRQITVNLHTFYSPDKLLVLKTVLAVILLITVHLSEWLLHHAQDSIVIVSIKCFDNFIKDFTNYLIIRQFHGLVDLATFQIRQINANVPELGNNVKIYPEDIENLLEKHSFFISVASQANEFYSQQLLIMCAYIFIKFIMTVFNSTSVVWSDTMAAVHAVTELVRAVALIYLLFITASSCENNRQEVELFNAKLFKISSERPLLSKNNKIRLYVEMKPTIEFTACNFFSIGYPLVSSMLAAATTYIVIIVQFNMGNK